MKKIAIHSVPRSGSSWVGQVFNSSPYVNFKFQPLFSYAFKNFLSESSSKKRIEKFFELISKNKDHFLNQKDKVDKGIYPLFIKDTQFTTIVYKEVRYHHILENMMKMDSKICVLGIVRNPYAVINSFLHSPREFRKDLKWDEMSEWRYAIKKNCGKKEEFYGYEKWKEVLTIFNKLKIKYPDRFYLVKYDDLLFDVSKEVLNIFNFFDMELTEQTEKFLYQSRHSNMEDVYSVYKDIIKDDKWKKMLNPTIVKAINKDLIDNCLYEFLDK